MKTSDEADKIPFVLLHGGRHGGWCWAKVVPLLEGAGHPVYTPTLSGLGARADELSQDIGLEDHVQDLVALFHTHDISNVVLVAHSYGGVVATGAMEHIHDRVRSLVYFDAQMPRTGESTLDLVEPDFAEHFLALARDHGEGWYLPPGDASYWGVTNPTDLAWANKLTTAQPLKTYTDKVQSAERAWMHPGMFIECSIPLAAVPIPLERPRQRSAEDRDFAYAVLEGPHDAMIAEPEALVDLLLQAARR